jgi:hypothetical protein
MIVKQKPSRLQIDKNIKMNFMQGPKAVALICRPYPIRTPSGRGSAPGIISSYYYFSPIHSGPLRGGLSLAKMKLKTLLKTAQRKTKQALLKTKKRS